MTESEEVSLRDCLSRLVVSKYHYNLWRNTNFRIMCFANGFLHRRETSVKSVPRSGVYSFTFNSSGCIIEAEGKTGVVREVEQESKKC